MRITRFIPCVLYGEKRFEDLDEFIDHSFPNKKQYVLYIIDSVHQETGLRERLRWFDEPPPVQRPTRR